ncbi:hypothetical protein ABEB36_007001 [Hypothenemus hampei]|uniref:Uncharacterized protein n=1 Tax=Hypothenemus hampei TaxID=57062 RepID=A0ABD1ESZ2_HYPHA
MGNAHIKPHPRVRNKKQVHWKAADRPSSPGKPELLPETEGTPDLITLRWLRPISDGGSSITGYLVEHRRVGSPHWVRATPLPVPYPEITLSGLEPGWRYQFRVSAENAVGISSPSEISEPITVTLQRSAVTAPKFTQEVSETVALENEKCEFVVHFLGQPAPKVCWFKDGFEIFSSRRIRILTEHDRSVLTIHQTSLSDEGEIKCTTTNRAGHVSSKAKLTVEAPPSIRLPRHYEEGLLFEIGEMIRIKMSIVGRPIPLVFCSHNGESLQNDERCEIEYSDKSYSIKIADAKRSDRGEYQIRAVNKLGSDTASFLVTVTDKPSPPGKITLPQLTSPGKARVVMTLGRSVTLSWTSPQDDGGCKIGNYIVEYYRLGWNVWLKAATSRQLTTRLGDLIEGSEYKFRIKAESPYGVSEPSEESDVIFIPDPKRGLTHPPTKKEPRSLSTPRVEFSLNETSQAPPERPKRTKSKSLQQTPESSPMFPRKDVVSQINKNIFDRSSIIKDLAYGLPNIKLQKEDSISNVANFEKFEEHDRAVFKVKLESPKEFSRPNILEPIPIPSPEVKKKLIREHSATVTGSSEFMLVLYSDENDQDQSGIFNFEENPVAPPLSLSAPELCDLELYELPPLKSSASSSELLHERTMARFNKAAEEEENALKKRKASSDRRPSYEIPKIQINSQENDDIVGLDRRLMRKLSSGSVAKHHSKWVQKRQSFKNSSELTNEIFPNNLKRAPQSLNMKRELMMRGEQTTSEELTDQEMEKRQVRKLYSQTSFENKSVTPNEEQRWHEEYEESMSESETDSESDIERFKFEVSRTRRVTLDYCSEEETYRPPGGLSGMIRPTSAPFEILNKRRQLPDPNFIPKPILKKTDSPLVSPTVSPPSSPTKVPRALSPRPDIVLERNRSKSLAVPDLPPLISSSGDESDEPTKVRKRSLSLTNAQSLLSPKNSPKMTRKDKSSTLPTINSAATISGITAASVVIPNNLIEKKNDEEAAKVVADHYDDIVRRIGQRRRSNPILDHEELKKAAEGQQVPQEDFSGKEQTPSKENLSQDSGYQSSYRRSSFTDHYDSFPRFTSPKRPSAVSIEKKTEASGPHTKEPSGRRLSDTGLNKEKPKTPSPRRDSGTGIQLGNFAVGLHSSTNSQQSGRRSSLTTGRSVSKSPAKRGTSTTRKGVLSPARPENWNPRTTEENPRTRKISPSPMRKGPKVGKSESPVVTRKPKLKEITTQTSGFLDSFENYSTESLQQELLSARAEVKVRTTVDWLTDLAVFAVACWLYVFGNELFAIPVLLIMVYRQLKEEVKKRIPNWMLKKLKKKPTE